MESLREPIIRSVCKLTLQAGFKSTSEAAIELLAEVLYRYLSSLSKNIADLSADGPYSFVNGIAALGLQGESVKLLHEYISEVSPYFPKPPKVFIPLQGKIQLNPPPTKGDPNNENAQSITGASLNDKVPTDPTSAKPDGLPGHLSTVTIRPNGRNLPSWASKSRYKLTCVSYNSTTHNLTTHSPPPPVKPVTHSNKLIGQRRSSRSTASTFRRPFQVSPPPSEFSGLPNDKKREDAWERALTATISPPPSQTHVKNALPTVNTPALSVAVASSAESKTAIAPSLTVGNKKPPVSNRRPPPNRRKSIYSRRKRPFSSVRLPPPQLIKDGLPSPPPPPPPSSSSSLKEDRSVLFQNRSPAVSLSPEKPPPFAGKMEPLTVNTDMAEMVHQHSSSSTVDRQSRRSDRQNTPVRRSRPSISSGGGSVFHESPLSPLGAGIVSSSLRRTEVSPKPLTFPSPPISQPTGGGGDDDFASSTDTEPMRCEEESRIYEIPAGRMVLTTSAVSVDRRSIQPSSMCSTAPSSTSSTLSSSHSTTSGRSDVKAPVMRTVLDSTTLMAPVKPLSETSHAPSLPGSFAFRQSGDGQAKTPQVTQSTTPQPVPMFTSGGGLKLTIRKVGETMSVQSSERALTNTISSPSSSDGIDGSSSSSSRDTSPLSSRHGSDAETAARRHAAIPSAFIANKTDAKVESSPRTFFSTSSQPQKQQQAEPSPLPKAPKIRIKWDAHGKASTSLISTEDSFTAPQRPSISLERLRGSSISNEGSSSSSTSRSQSSYDDDDEEDGSYPLPRVAPPIPPLFMLSDIPPRFNSSTTKTTVTTKQPPQLKPIHIELPLPKIDPLPPSPTPTLARDNLKKKSSVINAGESYQPSPPALPKLDLIAPITPTPSASRKRTVYSSDDSSSDEEEDKIPIPSASHSKRRGQAAKKRRVEEDKPVERQQLLASGGSSYYAVENGEKLWLCPICSLPGGDMVGCDGCDDWFHFQCVGLDKAPETEKWFCPSCTRSQASAVDFTKKAGSSTSRKHSQKHSSAKRR
nr:TAF3 RNA polymerase II TATA box binding protein [Hymenolepis microstoma]